MWLLINLPAAWEPAGQATQVSLPAASGLSMSKTTKPHHTPIALLAWLAERVMASSPNWVRAHQTQIARYTYSFYDKKKKTNQLQSRNALVWKGTQYRSKIRSASTPFLAISRDRKAIVLQFIFQSTYQRRVWLRRARRMRRRLAAALWKCASKSSLST